MPRPGDRISVSFLDHVLQACGEAKPAIIDLECRFVKDFPDYILVATWVSEKVLNGSDTDTYAIVKHRALKIKIL